MDNRFKSPEEKELIKKENMRKANIKYQQTSKYKNYKKEYWRKKMLDKIKLYIIMNDAQGFDNIDMFDKLLKDTHLYKNKFIEIYGPDVWKNNIMNKN